MTAVQCYKAEGRRVVILWWKDECYELKFFAVEVARLQGKLLGTPYFCKVSACCDVGSAIWPRSASRFCENANDRDYDPFLLPAGTHTPVHCVLIGHISTATEPQNPLVYSYLRKMGGGSKTWRALVHSTCAKSSGGAPDPCPRRASTATCLPGPVPSQRPRAADLDRLAKGCRPPAARRARSRGLRAAGSAESIMGSPRVYWDSGSVTRPERGRVIAADQAIAEGGRRLAARRARSRGPTGVGRVAEAQRLDAPWPILPRAVSGHQLEAAGLV